MEKLWTRDFTILTFGSVVSVFGNALAGFAISLMVLDYSESVFLFVLFMVAFNLPRAIAPMLAGPLLDTFSRRKTIYTMDFLTFALFLFLFFLLSGGFFNYLLLLALAFLKGTFDSIYLVAYESLYPVLVAKGNFRKAYSVSSMIMPLSAVMMPIAAFLYDRIGVGQILLYSAIAFFVAACLETQIRVDETHLRESKEQYRFSEFTKSLREGIAYIKEEKGLQVITAYFFVAMFAFSSHSLLLPYFTETPHLSVMLYTLVIGASVLGRVVGGAIQYKVELPKAKKFMIAMTVYVVSSFIEIGFIFTPVIVMTILMFTTGLITVTSFNIRMSTTQDYIPDEKRARFNGAFQMFMTIGTVSGQLIAGALAEVIPIRAVIVIYGSIVLTAAFAIMWRGRRHVMPIFNRTV
ncbi:MAG: MFS transporter [Oscillospiraceae bacterium]|nr:MFS transporter [Oscillospiraceae bacterium]MCL2280135.1 MFS transporter [Oscillospiraceae bacterium]